MKAINFTLFLLLINYYSFGQNPCGCDVTWDEESVCVSDSTGLTFPFVNNECLLNCLQLTIVDSSLCQIDTTAIFCDCPLDLEEPFVCHLRKK